jgi:capsid protein
MSKDALHWRKSSYSDSYGSNCVELAELGTAVGMRDSKNPDGGFLVLRKTVLRQLASQMRNL